MSLQTSESLVRSLVAGEARAQNAFVRQYAPLVRSIARSISPRIPDRTGEDVCMDLWLRVFRDRCSLLAKCLGARSFDAFLRTALKNVAFDIARRIAVERIRRVQAPVCSEETESWLDHAARGAGTVPGADIAAEEEELMAVARGAMTALPPSRRALLTSLLFEGRTPQLATAALGMAARNNRYKVKHRAMRQLKDAVARSLATDRETADRIEIHRMFRVFSTHVSQ